VGGYRAAVQTAAGALAGLDMSLSDPMMAQRAIRRVLQEFIVVKDRHVKKKLAKRTRRLWNINCHTMFRRMVARDKSMAETARAVQWPADNFTEIPVLAVACLRLGYGR
jgi:hypothetical protein